MNQHETITDLIDQTDDFAITEETSATIGGEPVTIRVVEEHSTDSLDRTLSHNRYVYIFDENEIILADSEAPVKNGGLSKSKQIDMCWDKAEATLFR